MDEPPELAVQILSPSTRRKDAVFKRSKYQEAGVGLYRIVDPYTPSLTALELVDGIYVTVADAAGEQCVELDHPFPVTIVPAALVAQPGR